jgi:hypothetical protein
MRLIPRFEVDSEFSAESETAALTHIHHQFYSVAATLQIPSTDPSANYIEIEVCFDAVVECGI